MARCVDLIEPGTRICIDVIGVGSSPFDYASDNYGDVRALNGSEKSIGKSKNGGLPFYNQRAEWHWRLREALDPASGEELMIPDDPELRHELTNIKWELTTRGVKVWDKESTKELIGRSPDKAESLIYAHATSMYPGEGVFEWYKKQSEQAQAEQVAKTKAVYGQQTNAVPGGWHG